MVLTDEEIEKEIKNAKGYIPAVNIHTEKGLIDVATDGIPQCLTILMGLPTEEERNQAGRRLLFYRNVIRALHGLPYEDGCVESYLEGIGYNSRK